MASLYKRATPSQVRILRAVEGAVKNAAHAHPHYIIPDSFARSVAKRATGTLTAQWPDVLAARLSRPSDRAEETLLASHQPRPRSTYQARSGRGSSDLLRRRSPLPELWKTLAAQIRPLKEAGHVDRAAAFVDVLKIISSMQRRLVPVGSTDKP